MTDKSVSASGQSWAKYFQPKNLKKDLPASVVVFLVALPLCLGIALASGAPLFAGVLTGIIGGIIVAGISGSQLSVTGPAAGLTVVVLSAIATLGSYEIFLLALVLAGILQIILGLVKAGTIGNYFPSSVIEGMLAAIGIILILKQIPHALGYDAVPEGSEQFIQADNETTFGTLLNAVSNMHYGAFIIALLSMAVLIFWPKFKKLSAVPAALIVVVLGVSLNYFFRNTAVELNPDHLVQIPIVDSFQSFRSLFIHPDFTAIFRPEVWTLAITLAIVASLETLLSVEAVDKIDPIKRVSPTNRELLAQGVGNTISGFLGGLPMTAVIVRSSANVNAGGRTKMSSIFHGIWLLIALLAIPSIINLIPLSALAAVLIFTGYKLAKWALFKKMWTLGKSQFIPFIVTILAIVFSDLLSGVAIGMLIGVFYILRNNFRNPYFYRVEIVGEQKHLHLKLSEDVSFLNKGAIQYTLTHIPAGSKVIIDGTDSRYIDRDVLEVIENFQQHAHTKSIDVELVNVRKYYTVPKLNALRINPSELYEGMKKQSVN